MKFREAAIFTAPSVLAMVSLLTVPLILTISWSFQNISFGAPTEWIGLDNYREILHSGRFGHAVTFTVGFALSLTAITMVLGYVLALMINFVGRFRAVFVGIFFIPFVLPTVVAGSVVSWMFNNTFGGVVSWLLSLVGVDIGWQLSAGPARFLIMTTEIWHGIAFPLIVILAGLQTIPSERLEAAAIDGVNWWQRQRFILMPSLARLLSFIALITIMDGLRIFDSIAVITPAAQSVGTESVMTYVYAVALGAEQRLGLASAINVLTTLITVVLIWPFIRNTFKDVKGS